VEYPSRLSDPDDLRNFGICPARQLKHSFQSGHFVSHAIEGTIDVAATRALPQCDEAATGLVKRFGVAMSSCERRRDFSKPWARGSRTGPRQPDELHFAACDGGRSNRRIAARETL
jgi:hypothetical protein